jgi:hypothetical protein
MQEISVLKGDGIAPASARPTSWRTFLRAHWGAIAGADFFTSEVWTPRGLITYHEERNHQGLGNELITSETRPLRATDVRCRQRLGGLLRYYHRAA